MLFRNDKKDNRDDAPGGNTQRVPLLPLRRSWKECHE